MKFSNWCSLIFCSIVWLLSLSNAVAGDLSLRLAEFPNWRSKPNVSVAQGDLFYPQWFAGTWEMRSTLIDTIAPLAPDLITPGFEANRAYLNVPVTTKVRFINRAKSNLSGDYLMPKVNKNNSEFDLISDRAFNGFNLATTYLGKNGVIEVKVDENNPNKQVTILPENRQLISVVSGRKTEIPTPEEFVTTEIFQQIFQSSSQIYLNEVETTSAYRYQPHSKAAIAAEQVTAIYLSPQDPDYFKAKDKPVALYRYHLEFTPANN